MAFSKDALRQLHAGMHGSLDVAVNHISQIPPELLTRELPGFGHHTVWEQMAHVFSCEICWVRSIQGLPYRRLEGADMAGMDGLRQTKLEAMRATLAYLEALDEGALNRQIDPLPARFTGPACSPAWILAHVITHAFHHKGQIAAMLRLLGHPAPDTDLQRD